MLQVKVVFVTDRFHKFRVRRQANMFHNGPRFHIRLGVVNRDLNIHVADVLAVEPFDHVQRIG